MQGGVGCGAIPALRIRQGWMNDLDRMEYLVKIRFSGLNYLGRRRVFNESRNQWIACYPGFRTPLSWLRKVGRCRRKLKGDYSVHYLGG